jgi:hypothetical protein
MRMYDVCSYRKGIPEDTNKCVEEVSDGTGWHMYQCSRKRGFGPNGEYCKQHAKKIAERETWTNRNKEMQTK